MCPRIGLTPREADLPPTVQGYSTFRCRQILALSEQVQTVFRDSVEDGQRNVWLSELGLRPAELAPCPTR
jgi:hypothetical protein